MEEFPDNSKKARKSTEAKPEPTKIEQVTTSKVIQRKKPLGKRFVELFVGNGDAKGVGGYVLFDVMIPAARDMIVDAGTEALHRTFNVESRGPSRRSRGSRSSGAFGHAEYNRYSSMSGRRSEESRPMSRRARTTHDFGEIILETRVEAEEVIDRLFDLVSQFERAKLSDLYRMVGIDAAYTDDTWGWYDLRGAGVTRIRNGYLLDLPRPEPLD